jgi:hypothetical protein
MEKVLIYSIQDIKTALKEAIREVEEEKAKTAIEPLYTINQVRLKTGKAHATIRKLVREGMIRSTRNGLIPKSALEEFISGR